MRILLGGAGGAPTNNVIRSLRRSRRGDHLIGMCSVPTDLILADVDERQVVPYASSERYPEALAGLIRRCRPDFLYVSHDFEVRAVSRLRAMIQELGVALYLPARETVENCVDKGKSYRIWK